MYNIAEHFFIGQRPARARVKKSYLKHRIIKTNCNMQWSLLKFAPSILVTRCLDMLNKTTLSSAALF